MIDSIYIQAKKVQMLASNFLCEGNTMRFTNVDEWQEMQRELAQCMNVLVRQEGKTIEEEAEIILAILMGYTLAIRNPFHIEMSLKRAERVLPVLGNSVLKCHLAAFCYAESGDEELLDMVYGLMKQLKVEGKGEEIGWVENLLESMTVE